MPYRTPSFACVSSGKTLTSRSPSIGLDGKKSFFVNKWISIADVGWATNTLVIYDGANHLVGVHDSISYLIPDLKGCSVVFTFTNFEIPRGPVVIKLSNGDSADISQNQIRQKVVVLRPDPSRSL